MNNDPVDEIFRSGLSDMSFSNKEALWQKLEKDMDHSRRRRLFWIIGCCLFVGSGIIFNISGSTDEADKLNQLTAIGTQPLISTPISPTSAQLPAVPSFNTNSQGNVLERHHKSLFTPNAGETLKPLFADPAGSKKFVSSAIIAGIGHEINDQGADIMPQRLAASVQLMPLAAPFKQPVEIPNILVAVNSAPKILVNTTKLKSFTVEAVAGSDIFHLNKNVGYYAGIRVSRNLDKGTAVSIGVNYSYNALNEKYRLSDKPLQQQETDAQLNNLKMLRFPIMIQLRVPATKLSLMAGLTPSYILSASVYNVPPGAAGNPGQYRQFTINDINRFNLLFGAGIKYTMLKRLAIELSGSYGFTEMVKDSYINQSNVNDNFKNIQAGVIWIIH